MPILKQCTIYIYDSLIFHMFFIKFWAHQFFIKHIQHLFWENNSLVLDFYIFYYFIIIFQENTIPFKWSISVIIQYLVKNIFYSIFLKNKLYF